MVKSFVTGTGKTIEIGQELGEGGEGAVYEVLHSNNLAAKIYNSHHQPDVLKQAKLQLMVTTADEELLSYAAWPQETLHKTIKGPVVGFLMPKISGRAPVHLLYSPAHRRQDYPQAAWDFLLFAARNTAAAFAAIHDHGHVLGDVNQGNVLVGTDSKVTLIDTDSFQINVNGTEHLCKVGVAHFTPPELQGVASFDRVPRTSNHDNFGLALLIFHLLFGGRHPYSGVPLRNDAGESLERDIQAFRYAYAPDGQQRGFKPPPRSIPVTLVPEHIQAMFTLAFTEKGAKGNRPTAQQWVTALDSLRSQLKRCTTSSMHVYPNHLGRCPWCTLEDHGVVYFLDVRVLGTTGATDFVLARIWAAIEAVQVPPPMTIPNISTIIVKPTISLPPSPPPLPPDATRDKKVALWRIAVVSIVLCFLVAFPEAWFLILGLGGWAWFMTSRIGEGKRKAELNERQEAYDAALQAAYDNARQTYYAARQAYDQTVIRIRQEVNPEAFIKKKQELVRLRDEYQQLPEREKAEIANLHATAEARQKQQFLERQFLDSASISGVGAAKKAALRSFGIETAADISWSKVIAVKGFGEVLTRAVVDWRKACERRFVFNPNLAVTETDKNAIRAKTMTRKRMLEASLNAGLSELQRLSQEMTSKANKLSHILLAASQKLAQAQANLNAIS